MSNKQRLFFGKKTTETALGEVYIRCPESPDEWMYMELQGEMKSTLAVAGTKDAIANAELRYIWNEPLGEFKQEGDKCTLEIGNLLLSGVCKNLPKPYLITEIVMKTTGQTADSENTFPASMSLDTNVEDTHLRVVGVVKRKILFNVRPQPLVKSLE